MRDPELFEERLGVALRQYADEVPSEADAAEIARAVAAGGRSRGWSWIGDLLPARAASVLWTVLAMAAVPAALAGMLLLTHQIRPAPYEGVLTGQMACAGGSWTLADTAIALDCTVTVQDPRASGPLHLVLDAPMGEPPRRTWSGTLGLRGEPGTWTGRVTLTTAPNGVTSGNLWLTGDGGNAGLELDLRLVTADGIHWGLTGTMTRAESGR